MKINHYSFSSGGGAGKIARMLAQQQSKIGLEVNLISKIETNLFQESFKAPITSAMAALDRHAFTKRNNESLFSLLRDFSGKKLVSEYETVHHLHWTPGLIRTNSIKNFMPHDLPVVWTLHDMWAFTGGCHYSLNCDGFESGCSTCPQTKNIFRKIPGQINNKKKLSYGSGRHKTIFVAPSQWILRLARNSTILSAADIRLIPNPLDSDFFDKRPNNSMKLGGISLSEFDLIIGCGAMNLADPVKGISTVIESVIQFAKSKEYEHKKIMIIAIGNGSLKLSDSLENLQLFCTGALAPSEVVNYLNIMDIFIHMPLQENYANSVLEALSCEVPIICNNVGGLPEIVQNSKAGFIVNDGITLVKTLKNLTKNKSSLKEFGRKGRGFIKDNLNLKSINDKYLEIYYEILNK